MASNPFSEDTSPLTDTEGRAPYTIKCLVDIVVNKECNYPAEIRANACALITAIARIPDNGPSEGERNSFRDYLKQPLEDALNPGSSLQIDKLVKESINKALAVL
jgi:hypothetical protein